MKHKTLTFRFLDMSRGGFARLFLLLLLPCLSVIGVKAADSNGGVKVTFNPAVRYSQWAINSRLHDFYGNQKKFGFDYYDNNGKKTATVTWYKLDGTTKVDRTFDYVAGLVGKASLEAADFYEKFDWSKPWFYAAQGYATGKPYANSSMTLDNMNAAKMYFPILAGNLKSQEATTVANTAITAVINDMKTYNTTYVIGSGKSALDNTNANDVQKSMFGGWFHKSTDYTDQMWCDGQYMGPALLAQIIKHTGKTNNISDNDNDWDIIAKQFSITWAQLYDKTTGLLYHGFTANPGDDASKSWAGIDKEKGIYHSASFWGRANAWYFLALVDILEVMPTNNTYYNTFKGYLTDLAAGIKKYQDETTGCWYQVMDKVPASLTGNYLEASCSSIFTAGYLKAIRLGLLDKTTYEPIAKKAYEGLVNQFMVYDNTDNSTIQLVHSCTSAGLGGSSNRPGNDNYYLNGKDASVVTSSDPTSKYYYTEGKVLGGFIMAATEYERAYQNQESKQILFARDLAPSYDFTANAGTLDATAYGNGTVSYQWYKDGSAIADAKSATYTPKESGNYYCIATSATNSRSAGGNTIQTSTTTVTTANTDNGSTDNGGSDNGSASDGTVTFSGDQLKNYSSPMTDASKIVTITTLVDPIQKESGGDIKVQKNAAFSISVAKGKYIKSITYKMKDSSNGELTFNPTDAKRVTSSDKLTYTYNYSDNKLSTVTATNSANKGGIQVTSIKVVYGTISSVKKYTVSATAGTGGSVTIANAGTTVNSGSEVEENTSLTFTATPNEGYEFVNWTDANNKPVSTEATYTTTVTAAISLTANFKTKTPVTPTEDDVIYNWNTIGSQKENIAVTEGTKNINGTSVPCINFGSNYDVRRYTYISIKDKYNGGFKAGDIITITGLYTGTKTTGIGMEIHTTRDGKAVFSTPYYDKELKTYTYTLTEDCDSLFFGRYGGATPNVTELKVVRPAASAKQQLSANFDTNNIKVVTGTTSITLPNLTVKAGSTELTASDYSVSYKSDANEIATLNGTQVNFNAGKTGLVTITAKVTPKDAAKYEGTEAYYQIRIQDPTPLNISVTDIDMNTTDAEIKEPVVKVYGENDQLLKLGTDYTLSYKSNGGPVSFPNGKLTVAGSKYNWTVGVTTITVTATPKENLDKKYKEGSVDFTYAVTKGLITPKFLDVFSGANIKLAVKSDDKNNFNTFTVPLIYDGEDVSSYFDYTYEITSTSTANQKSVNGNVLTYYPKNAGTYTVTVSATVKKNEKDPTSDYTDVYAAPSSITFTLDVKANYIRPVVKLNPVSVNMYTGTREDAPDVTITDYNTGKVIDESNYKVSWTTFTPGICKVDANGNIEAVSEGDGEVRVTVTGDNMESTTAFLKVLVDDPAMFRVKGTGTYGNQTRMWNQDKTLSVVLGGWMFPNPVSTNGPTSPTQGPSTEGLSADFHWGTDKNLSSLPKWKLTGFDYYVVGDKNKNARQENGSNALPETTKIYSADFNSYKGTIKDKMFNVPCSGSFLEFNPATNGKVTVHIFQNGAFDSGVYRPQRRVFIMDEAGNFVESEAHIETTSGKPTGGIQPISSYKWDLNPDGKDTAPTTIDQVRSHFKGIPDTFDMTANAFKNDVYESLLSNDLVPNAAAGKGKGSHGWSVLADSPVTYTFNVKAGKTYYLYNFGSKIGFYGFSFDEDETKPTVDEVNYNADDANANNVVEKTAEGHVAQVKIARKMVANRWTTCVLPFSLNRQQVDAIFGPAYSAAYPQGTQILYFDRVEGNKVYFVRHAYNTIVAGKPFLIKPTKDVTSINTAEIPDYPYVTIENTKPEDWCTGNGYTWASSYSNDMTVQAGDGFISNRDGSFKNFVDKSGTLNGFRGYLKRLGTQTNAKPMMLQVVNSSNVDGNNDETTGIEDLIIDADGQLMPANGKVYNINGQLVSEDVNSFQSLPSGIYIINGKKYIK